MLPHVTALDVSVLQRIEVLLQSVTQLSKNAAYCINCSILYMLENKMLWMTVSLIICFSGNMMNTNVCRGGFTGLSWFIMHQMTSYYVVSDIAH